MKVPLKDLDRIASNCKQHYLNASDGFKYEIPIYIDADYYELHTLYVKYDFHIGWYLYLPDIEQALRERIERQQATIHKLEEWIEAIAKHEQVPDWMQQSARSLLAQEQER